MNEGREQAVTVPRDGPSGSPRPAFRERHPEAAWMNGLRVTSRAVCSGEQGQEFALGFIPTKARVNR